MIHIPNNNEIYDPPRVDAFYQIVAGSRVDSLRFIVSTARILFSIIYGNWKNSCLSKKTNILQNAQAKWRISIW